MHINASDEQFDIAWNAILLDIPKERIELLLNLGKEYRIFMLSNTNSIHMIRMNQYLRNVFGINTYKDIFEKAYYSFEMGMRKPEREIFEFVLKDSGLNPSETLFIEDTQNNIDTARQLGIQTYFINKSQDVVKIFL